MAFSSLPLSYKSLQENISSMYKKSMNPFSFRKMEEETTEQRCAKQQSENLKWQQDMFHKILKMSGLHSEGIISEKELSAARSELLDTLIASPEDGEWPAITRDKLLFLQELFYSKCISEEDYHLSKKPLLLRLAVQGAEIDSRDVLLRGNSTPYAPFTVSTEPDDALQAWPESLNNQATEWSVVEFKEDQSMLKDMPAQNTGHHSKQKSPMKQVINAISRLSLTPYKAKKSKDKHQYVTVPDSLDLLSPKDCCPARNTYTSPIKEGYKGQDIYINPTESFSENPFWHVAGLLDAPEAAAKRTSEEPSLLEQTCHKKGATKGKVKKAFNQLLLRANKDQSKESQTEASHSFHISGSDSENDEQRLNPVKKTWGLDLFKSPKKIDTTGEMPHLPLIGKSSEESLSHSNLVVKPFGKGTKTNKSRKKKRSDGAATDSSIDKVLGENIKNELSRIRAEMGTTNPSPNFTNEQIEAIATQLPVDKNELTKFFPKSWCDRYGDVVLDVVKEEFQHHVGGMENMRRTDQERFNNTARKGDLEDRDVNCPVTNKARQRTPKSMSSDSVNGSLNMQDENSQPNISAFSCHQSKSPFPFHSPISKPSSRLNQAPHPPAKSPPPFNHIENRESPSSPFFQ
ncbi:hypothetical protein SUGI_0898170 [Cryptomeria japonica]|uniref:uncharacterized protein LOC131072989 n=1 Tax=Cryptomeria japonica TaxID=3369 RepID=UPI0024148B8A|nr:uncharacterized protein LOC131072989 [Cryptomeria japonica]GLJ43258.1 hypothetical protein SUGI_0898170 [Cryptomeria japonica]